MNKLNRIGLKRIEIPISEEEVSCETIKLYWSRCLSTFTSNLSTMQRLHDVYLGVQSIGDKERYTSDSKSNEQIVENHAYNIVDFKSSYNLSEPIQYSIANETLSTDDISELNMYMREIHKDSLDMDNAEDMYCTGLTTRLIMPNTDNDSVSPFKIYNLSYDGGFVVYSSGYKHEKLFGCVISKISDNEYVYTCYAKNGIYTIRTNQGDWVCTKSYNPTEMVNMVECKTNKYYTSPIDVVLTILDAINTLSSNSVDNVVDFVNSILVIINQDFTQEDLDMVRNNLALSLKSTPNMQADAKFLVNSLNYTDVNVVYDTLVKTAYDIVGVPRTSTTITSGGDTGQARLLGGGWTKAEQVAKKEEKFIKQAEREMLDIILKICKKNPNCNVNLNCGDIKIDLNRTPHDNVLAKCQSAMNLYQIGMPEEVILQFVGFTTNTHEIASKWRQNVEEKERKQQEELSNYTNDHFSEVE